MNAPLLRARLSGTACVTEETLTVGPESFRRVTIAPAGNGGPDGYARLRVTLLPE